LRRPPAGQPHHAAVLAQEANFLITVPVIALDVWVASAGGERLAQMARTGCVALPAAAPYFQKMTADFSFAVVPLKTLCNNGGVMRGRPAWHP